MDSIEREIERLRRLHAALLADARPAPAAWEVAGARLVWHVVLRDALEPDVDVEVLDTALVVRAATPAGLRQALLPVPRPYDTTRVVMRFYSGVLEVVAERGGA